MLLLADHAPDLLGGQPGEGVVAVRVRRTPLPFRLFDEGSKLLRGQLPHLEVPVSVLRRLRLGSHHVLLRAAAYLYYTSFPTAKQVPF